MNIYHLITGMQTGGAETALFKLLKYSQGRPYRGKVFSVTGEGPMASKIRTLGIEVECLKISGPVSALNGIRKLKKALKDGKPDVLQTWMYHADLIGGMASFLGPNVPVVWGIRNSNLDKTHSKRITRLVAAICAATSGTLATKIISCSDVAKEVHVSLGYKDSLFEVIPNGFDLTLFRPDPIARERIRAGLKIRGDTCLIGMVARYDPQKDHECFLRAASLLADSCQNVSFLLCGDGLTCENKVVTDLIRQLNLNGRVILLGRRDDIPAISAALDIGTLSSAYGEAFPNTIGEAMSCGVPCVGTDVGDTAYIIGDTGFVVSPRNAVALSEALRKLVVMSPDERSRIGERARKRVVDEFEIGKIVFKYHEAYRSLT